MKDFLMYSDIPLKIFDELKVVIGSDRERDFPFGWFERVGLAAEANQSYRLPGGAQSAPGPIRRLKAIQERQSGAASRAIPEGSIIMLAAHPYAPILVLILVVIGMVGLILALTHMVGPTRRGRVKDETYEAGMAPVGDARRRFNVRFYLVAMIFLLFDVEVVFLWPWATIFYEAAVHGREIVTADGSFGKTFLLVHMAIFTGLLLIGYIYDWRKGLFRWA